MHFLLVRALCYLNDGHQLKTCYGGEGCNYSHERKARWGARSIQLDSMHVTRGVPTENGSSFTLHSSFSELSNVKVFWRLILFLPTAMGIMSRSRRWKRFRLLSRVCSCVLATACAETQEIDSATKYLKELNQPDS